MPYPLMANKVHFLRFIEFKDLAYYTLLETFKKENIMNSDTRKQNGFQQMQLCFSYGSSYAFQLSQNTNRFKRINNVDMLLTKTKIIS